MISTDDYRFLAELLHRQSGLALGDGKEYLLESRLPPVATRLGFSDLAALVKSLRARPSADVEKAVCDAMTTGETFFYRDTTPFTVLERELLPEVAERVMTKGGGRPIRIWCAACSTGQEPYSIAMILEKMAGKLGGAKIEMVASDYSTPTLARAKEGIYNQFEVQRGLPVTDLVRFFQQVPAGFQVKDDLRNRISFREQNLLKPFGTLGMFDIVFIRNVLIYFDTVTKRDVLERIARQLHPGGAVLLGGTENTLGITTKLVRVQGASAPVYRHPADAAAAGKAVA